MLDQDCQGMWVAGGWVGGWLVGWLATCTLLVHSGTCTDGSRRLAVTLM